MACDPLLTHKRDPYGDIADDGLIWQSMRCRALDSMEWLWAREAMPRSSEDFRRPRKPVCVLGTCVRIRDHKELTPE